MYCYIMARLSLPAQRLQHWVMRVSSPSVWCTLPQNCQRNDLGLLSLYMNAFLFFFVGSGWPCWFNYNNCVCMYEKFEISMAIYCHVYKPETEKATEWWTKHWNNLCTLLFKRGKGKLLSSMILSWGVSKIVEQVWLGCMNHSDIRGNRLHPSKKWWVE